MNKYDSLIFVCTGNTCRSPMAEAIYKSFETESDIKVISRGLVVLFSEPINPKAETVLSKHGLKPANHVSKGLKKADIEENSLILTMTENQKKRIQELFPNTKQVFTIKEFVGEMGDVVDPYGGSLVEYEDCYVELARLVKKTVYKIHELTT